MTRPCVVAELTKQAERQSLQVEDLLPRELWQISFDLDAVLDLTDADTTRPLGIHDEDLVREDHRLTQEIGEAAYEHHFQAVRSWSATGVDEILAIFPENLAGRVLNAELLETWSNLPDLRLLL